MLLFAIPSNIINHAKNTTQYIAGKTKTRIQRGCDKNNNEGLLP